MPLCGVESPNRASVRAPAQPQCRNPINNARQDSTDTGSRKHAQQRRGGQSRDEGYLCLDGFTLKSLLSNQTLSARPEFKQFTDSNTIVGPTNPRLCIKGLSYRSARYDSTENTRRSTSGTPLLNQIRKYNNIDIPTIDIILSLPREMNETDLRKNIKSIRLNINKLSKENLKLTRMLKYINNLVIIDRNLMGFYDTELKQQYKITRCLWDTLTEQLETVLQETKPPSHHQLI